LIKRLGLPVQFSLDTPDRVIVRQRIFLTGTSMEICPVIAVDGVHVGDGKPDR
jgi:branched-subunit amino acid aminotransferase/4-amino-4-deoxychorismate lyase